MVAAAARLRAARPGAIVACDPVMGDEATGLYVPAAVAEAISRRVVPAADVVTPNGFELARLAGRRVGDVETALAAARAVLEQGPRLVLVTSLEQRGAEPTVTMLAVTGAAAWSVVTPWLAIEPAPNGGGDAVAALFLAHLLKGAEPPEALAASAAAIHAVFAATQAAGRRELALIEAQAALAEPPRRFPVETID